MGGAHVLSRQALDRDFLFLCFFLLQCKLYTACVTTRMCDAVNSSTFTQRSCATASSLTHSMRMWPVSSSGPSRKMQGCARITVRVTFCRHRRMTRMVGRRPSPARSKSLRV